MNENQRQFPRTEIQVKVELSYLDDSAKTVTTRDISEGGLFMTLDDPAHYPVGELVHVTYNNPLQDDAEVIKDAIIVRQAEKGIAVAFIEMEEFLE